MYLLQGVTGHSLENLEPGTVKAPNEDWGVGGWGSAVECWSTVLDPGLKPETVLHL